MFLPQCHGRFKLSLRLQSLHFFKTTGIFELKGYLNTKTEICSNFEQPPTMRRLKLFRAAAL